MEREGAEVRGATRDDGPTWIKSSTHKDTTWSGATDVTLWHPTSGKRFIVTDILIVCTTAGTVVLYDGADADNSRIAAGAFAANGGLNRTPRTPYRSTAVDQDLHFKATGGSGYVIVDGYEE